MLVEPCGCAVDVARDWCELGLEAIELSEGPAVCVLQRFAVVTVVAWLDGGVSQGRRIMECRGIPEDGDGMRRYRFCSQKYTSLERSVEWLRHFAGGLEDDLQCEGNPTPRQQ